MAKKRQEYMLVRDNDGHWYVIPAGRDEEFDAWCESDEYELGETPEWADRIGGSPSLILFPSYRYTTNEH